MIPEEVGLGMSINPTLKEFVKKGVVHRDQVRYTRLPLVWKVGLVVIDLTAGSVFVG